MCTLGTSDGPFVVILDCLTLIFILELDNMMQFGSKGTLFGKAGKDSNQKKFLSKQLRTIAAAVLDSGTKWRYYQANLENALVMTLSVFMTIGTCRMQRITSKGELTMSDDPDHKGMQETVHSMQFLLMLTVVVLIVATRRFALRSDLLTCAALFFFDSLVVVHINYYVGYYVLSSILIFGDTDFSYYKTYEDWKTGVSPFSSRDDDGWIVDDALVDARFRY